jgi:hypothetical protein
MSLRHRPTRILTVLAISGGLLIASMAAPVLGKLATVTVTATAVPGSVTPGKNVAIDVEFYNFPSTSNISQLFLDAATPTDWTLVTVESFSQGSCTWATDVHCDIGAVNAGGKFDARIVYTTPSNVTGTLSVNLNWFIFNTTGVAGDKKGNSHGDNYFSAGSMTLDSTKDFGGAYTSSANQIVSDNQVLHVTRNPQFTSVTSPDPLIGVTVGELPGNTFICPSDAGTCFGQWSVISVNDGASYPNGFSVLLGYKGNIANASFVHLFDTYDPVTNPTAYELITSDDICPATLTPSVIPCMTGWSSSGGNSYVTLWLNQNGQLKAY